MLNNLAGVLSVPIATPVTPPVSGYTLWLDASDASSFTYSSGALVSAWNDKSGNSNNFTQSTVANQPLRATGLQNGLPGVRFRPNSSTDYRWLSRTFDWAASANTFFAVVKIENNAYQSIFSVDVSSGLSYAVGDFGSAPARPYALFRNNIAPFAFSNGFQATTTNADVAVFKSPAVSGGSVTSQFYKNGADGGTATATGLVSSTTATVGANTTAESLYGYICEILYYPSQLSDANRNSVEAYLKTKWGTP